jgi:2,4-dienoyl-CoA reductase-like NADH-dependent reductase (Old Yellow Enzyme family)
MAPLTRCRADYKTLIPNDLHIQYYTERAEDAGIVFTECTTVSARGSGFPGNCGIYTSEQVEGWKKVTESVHKVGGKIFLQIWHVGRATKGEWFSQEQPYCPSAVQNRHAAYGATGKTTYDEPKEMTKEDIEEVVEQFRQGAKNAKEAGFDGLELHGANGYLIDQFLRDGVNKRTDEFGGSVENKCRFPLMVIDVLVEVFGHENVGIKVSPIGRFNDMFDSDPVATYTHLLKELAKRNVAFVEIVRGPEFMKVENFYGINGEDQIANVYETFRPVWNGILIANLNYSFEEANKELEAGLADMVSFGRFYIANPDLTLRWENGWELNECRPNLFYSPGPEGYTDYPKYEKK